MALCNQTSNAFAQNFQSQSFSTLGAVANRSGCCPGLSWNDSQWARLGAGHCGRLPCHVDYLKVASLEKCRNRGRPLDLSRQRLQCRWRLQAAICRLPLTKSIEDMHVERRESGSHFLDTGPAAFPSSARLFVRKWTSDLRKLGASAALQAGWNVFLPQQYTYSTDLKDVDPQQLSDLWERTLEEKRNPHRCALAMRKSFAEAQFRDAALQVIVREHHTETSNWRPSVVNPGTRIIGVARAISDGEFMATVCDVAVDPDYTGRGIGRKVVQTLVRNMKLRGPTGFAAFPPPKARRFFFMLGFRIDKKYRLMSYEGNGEFPDPRDEQAKLKGARRESQGLIGKVTGSQPGFDSDTSVASEGAAATGE